ncbi:MAG: Na+/H+ antiporter NhaA, partial [Bdellovibrionales bacterium]|nr:Na+/H+ antiporter NhaA [Bdellovibrionales bacterium]
VGKQLGIFGFSYLAIKLRWVPLPKDCSWLLLYGISTLGGIGFTMSLFISNLAFKGSDHSLEAAKLAILLGSLASGALGALIIHLATSTKSEQTCVVK